MNTLFVCTLIIRAIIDGQPLGYFQCTDGQFQCYVTRTDRSAWISHFNTNCDGEVVTPVRQ